MPIQFRHDVDQVLKDANAQQKAVLLDFSAAPMRSGCARLDAEVWPDERVVRFVNQHFLAARVHVKDDAAEFKRYGERYNAPWTPTILELDADGVERHRVEGFLPADDLLAQLTLGLAHMGFQQQRWADAERGFREIVQQFPHTDAAPEALYWAGVARYKATGNAASLNDTARAFTQRYQDSTWAKKASVWR